MGALARVSPKKSVRRPRQEAVYGEVRAPEGADGSNSNPEGSSPQYPVSVPAPSSSPNRAQTLSYVLVAAGWLLSGYLLLPSLGIGSGGPRCLGCGEALSGPSSWQLGLPLAGIGIVYFAAVGLLLALRWKITSRIAVVLCAVGVGASIVLSTYLLIGPTAACPLCLATHVVNLGLLASLWRSVRESTPGPEANFFSRKAGIGVLAAAFVSGAAIEATLYQTGPAPVDPIATFEAEPVLEPLVSPEGRTADSAASVQMVIFSSFQCPACKAFASTTDLLRERFGDQLAISFKNFPLSTACNQALQIDMQPRSCQAARAAEAARLQGAFWPYHDGLFASDLSASEEALEQIARASGLDEEQWEADRGSDAVQERIRDEVKLGLDVGVDGTPSVYIDGRRVRQPSLEALTILIEHELEERGFAR